MRKNFIQHCIGLLPVLLIMLSQSAIGQLVTNTNTTLTYSTIQAAIDDPLTLDGHTLSLAAGTYFENVLVNKKLTINGPNAGTDGNSTRIAEAIIMPAIGSIGDGNFNGGKIIDITADNVTLDGLMIDGANPNIPSVGFEANGVSFDVDFGISSHGGWDGADPDLAGDNIIIRNNIIQNVFRCAIVMWGAYSSPDAHFGQIKNNKIQNVPYSNGASIFLIQNYYAAIEDNIFIDTYNAVLCYFYWLAKPAGSNPTIKNNTVITKTQDITNIGLLKDVKGFTYHFIYGFADPWTISNNTLTNTTPGSTESSGIGIYIDWTSDPVHVSNNNITGFENGYRLATSSNPIVPNSSIIPTTVTGGTLSNNTYGVTASNFNYNGNHGAYPSVFNINGVTIQNSTGAGVFVDDNASSLTHATVAVNVSNCKINGGSVGILLNNPICSATAHNNDLSNNSVYAIQSIAIKPKNLSSFVDATCNWYGHWSGPSNTFGSLGTPISGNKITFAPWLTTGTDDDVAQGFQPVPGSCDNNCGKNFNKLSFCIEGKTKCVAILNPDQTFPPNDAFYYVSLSYPIGACPPSSNTNTGNIVPEELSALQFKITTAPNPFVNSTTLKYELPFDSKVSIKVYDMMGKEVASLVNSEKKAGVYTVSFDATRLSKGMYYYRLNAFAKEKEFTQSGKILKQ